MGNSPKTVLTDEETAAWRDQRARGSPAAESSRCHPPPPQFLLARLSASLGHGAEAPIYPGVLYTQGIRPLAPPPAFCTLGTGTHFVVA